MGVQLDAVRIPPSQALKACPALLRRCPPFDDQVLHPKTQLASTRLAPDHTVEYSPFLTSWERLRRVSQANLGRRLGNDIELQSSSAVEHPGATQTRQYVDARNPQVVMASRLLLTPGKSQSRIGDGGGKRSRSAAVVRIS